MSILHTCPSIYRSYAVGTIANIRGNIIMISKTHSGSGHKEWQIRTPQCFALNPFNFELRDSPWALVDLLVKWFATCSASVVYVHFLGVFLTVDFIPSFSSHLIPRAPHFAPPHTHNYENNWQRNTILLPVLRYIKSSTS